MQLIENVDMWTVQDGVHVVTTNGQIRRARCANAPSALTMGKGAALQARQYHHNIQYHAAARVMELGRLSAGYWYYGFMMILPNFGIFQVKDDPYRPAKVTLIRRAVVELAECARRNPDITFHLNYPGIGAGGLDMRDVAELLAPLPDNVRVYRSGM